MPVSWRKDVLRPQKINRFILGGFVTFKSIKREVLGGGWWS